MRYFKDRQEAGKLLAEQLMDYAPQNCAVLALSEGGLVVGAEVAKKVHASLFLLSMEDITLPRELVPLATMTNAGTFTYNHSLSNADLEEITNESRNLIDQMKLETFQKLNRLISKDGPINKQLLNRHQVIVVSDGIYNGLSLDVASDFLRPVASKGIVVATPLCNGEVVDKIRLMSDAFYCLDFVSDEFPLSHYYTDDSVPDHDTAVEIMRNISLQW